MKDKMTNTQVQQLIDNNELSDEEYVEVQIPNFMLKVITLLFPAKDEEESVQLMLKNHIDANKETLYN